MSTVTKTSEQMLYLMACALQDVSAQEEFLPDVDLQQLFKRASIKANKSVLISILRLVYRSFEQQGSILSLAVFCAPGAYTFRGNRPRAGRADRNNDAKKRLAAAGFTGIRLLREGG